MGDLLEQKGDLLKQADSQREELLLELPNLPHESVPDGETDEDNVELKRVGEPSSMADPKDHVDLGRGAGDDRPGARGAPVGLAVRVPARPGACSWSSRWSGTASTCWRRTGSRRSSRPCSSARRRCTARASSRPTRPRSTRRRRTTCTWSAPARSRSPAFTRARSSTRTSLPAALRRVLDVLPPRGRHVRQGHAGDLPGPPVRQGRDVLVRVARGVVGRARVPGRAARRRSRRGSGCRTGW